MEIALSGTLLRQTYFPLSRFFLSYTLLTSQIPSHCYERSVSWLIASDICFYYNDNVNSAARWKAFGWATRRFHHVKWFPEFPKSKLASSPRRGSIGNMAGNNRLDYAGWRGDEMEVLPSALLTLCREQHPPPPPHPSLPSLPLSPRVSPSPGWVMKRSLSRCSRMYCKLGTYSCRTLRFTPDVAFLIRTETLDARWRCSRSGRSAELRILWTQFTRLWTSRGNYDSQTRE